ncbi:MAG: hypothetical protein UT05_C0010G0008 [Parcubacteria group bacterium GW2011_GWF2_38_76]|nr:MAG: hypothetical protein UT05_C0010G0008 [Parcubacteria group bacterium GW2011_GWF2_38_76]HBM45561.1 hypothetical protein [Patescibacteria group bacterium]
MNSFSQVELHFRLQSVPSAIVIKDPETPKEKEERLNHSKKPTGTMIVTPTERCQLVEFLKDLKKNGYQLIDAHAQERSDDKVPCGIRRNYYSVRFIFSKLNPAVRVDMASDLYSRVAYNELYFICSTAIYQVKAFINPVDINKKVLNITLKSRLPLYEKNGQRVMVWNKDENDIATDKILLEPKNCLRILDNSVISIKA